MDYMLNYILFSCLKLVHINVQSFFYANYQFTSSWYNSTRRDKVITHKMKDSILSSSIAKNIIEYHLADVTISSQLFHMLNNSFYNIESLLILNCTFTEDNHHNHHMYFSGISSLKSLELDRHYLNVRSDSSHVFFQSEHIDNNGDKKYEYYKYDDDSSDQLLLTTTQTFMYSNNRVNSLGTTVIFIKFAKIDQITLICDDDIDIEITSFDQAPVQRFLYDDSPEFF